MSAQLQRQMVVKDTALISLKMGLGFPCQGLGESAGVRTAAPAILCPRLDANSAVMLSMHIYMHILQLLGIVLCLWSAKGIGCCVQNPNPTCCVQKVMSVQLEQQLAWKGT